MQEYEGALSFGTDAWTSPNHKAYVAVTVHFQRNGKLMCMLLDLVEVATSTFWEESRSCICQNTLQFWDRTQGEYDGHTA